ncbi:MAG: Hsp20 family protein, partial [Clostridia bacterium]|nr:Hsp20 family protein [Clostridia bacterium]
RSGSVKRSFNVENIEEGLITARYENGVLTLDLPKIQPEKKEPRKIDIL